MEKLAWLAGETQTLGDTLMGAAKVKLEAEAVGMKAVTNLEETTGEDPQETGARLETIVEEVQTLGRKLKVLELQGSPWISRMVRTWYREAYELGNKLSGIAEKQMEDSDSNDDNERKGECKGADEGAHEAEAKGGKKRKRKQDEAENDLDELVGKQDRVVVATGEQPESTGKERTPLEIEGQRLFEKGKMTKNHRS